MAKIKDSYVKFNVIEYSNMTFETLFKLMKLDYSIKIDYLEKSKEVTSSKDKTIENKWFLDASTLKNTKVKITKDEKILSETEIMTTTAFIEDSLSKEKAYIEKFLLPRNVRVTPKTTTVIFLKTTDKFYGIVKGDSTRRGNITSRLQGGRSSNNLVKTPWEKYKFKNNLSLCGDKFEDDFFYWLINAIETNKIIDNDMKIYDVFYVSDNDEELAKAHTNTGKSIITRDSSVSASLGSNNKLDKLGFRVQIDKLFDFKLIVESSTEIKLETNTSRIFESDSYKYYNDSDIDKYVNIIYSFILPKLYKSYSNDSNWNNNVRKTAQMKFAYKTICHMAEIMSLKIYKDSGTEKEISINSNENFDETWKIVFKK